MGLKKSANHPETETFLRHPSEPAKDRKDPRHRPAGRSSNSTDAGRPVPDDVTDSSSLAGLSDQFLTQLKDLKAFWVLAVQIDGIPNGSATEQHSDSLENVLTTAAAQHHGRWARWRDRLYLLVLPEIEQERATATAQDLRETFAEKTALTITIGIAPYPLLSFNHNQSLVNARKAIDHAAFFGPGSCTVFDSVSLNISADTFYQAGDIDAAVAEYRLALHLDPQNANVHNSLGVCLAKQNDLSAARACFQAALTNNDGDAMALHNLGMVHLLENNSQKAMAFFQQAFERDPATFETLYHIGKLLTEKGRWQEAVAYLEKAAACGKNNGQVFNLLGRCKVMLKKIPEAVTAYKKAVKCNPYDADALSALGSLYDAKGENPEICLTFCRQSVMLAPENGRYRERLARLYRKYDRIDQALAEYQKAAELGRECQRQIDEIRRLSAADGAKQCCA